MWSGLTMQQKALYAVLGLLVTLIGWLGSINFQKLMEIEHSLAELKIEVAKLQMGIIDEHKLREIANEIVDKELLKRGLK